MTFFCNLAQASNEWKKFNPNHIMTEAKIKAVYRWQEKISITAKGFVGTCDKLRDERTKFKTKLVSCNNGHIELTADYKNKANCEYQQIRPVITKLKLKVSEACYREFSSHGGISTVTINGTLFENH
tara:strand:- start:740 stop:1120 length:381 start_codon:yes stop_codon:yes gene_type:complete